MLKNNKGITMIALVITIIILMILSSIITYNGLSTVRNSRYYNAVSEMKVMQIKVNEYYEDYKNGDTSFWDKGKALSESGKETQAEKAYNSTKENNLNGSDIGLITDYKYYDKDTIKENLDIDGIDYDFIININTRTVILVDGIEKDGVIYYSLCEIEDEQYNVEYERDFICALIDDLGTSATIYLYGNSEQIKTGEIKITMPDNTTATITATSNNTNITDSLNYATYTVKKNGSYIFSATNEAGKTKKIIVKVKNIETFTAVADLGLEWATLKDGTKSTKAYNYKGASVPVGYYVDTKTNVKTGLVVTDEIDSEGYSTGNEWVWVPVNRTVGNHELYIAETGTFAGATSVSYDKYSKLYSFSQAKIRDEYGSNTFYAYGNSSTEALGKPSGTSGYREPSLLSNSSYDETTYYSSINKRGTTTPFTEAEGVTAVATQYKTDYNNMITSVENYGGFYIGRYEITANGEKTGDALVKKNWYYLYNECMKLGKEDTNSNVITESGMIYGTLWDATMQWLAKSDISVGCTENTTSGYGIYETEAVKVKNSKTTIIVKPSGTRKKLKTGQTSYTRSNNIYDLSGNCYDWTQEARNTSSRVGRGGCYDNTDSNDTYSADRTSYYATDTYGSISSRPFLYIR